MNSVHKRIEADLSSFGGHLECNSCGATSPLGSIARKLATGWPKCCGYTMTWRTARQVEVQGRDTLTVYVGQVIDQDLAIKINQARQVEVNDLASKD